MTEDIRDYLMRRFIESEREWLGEYGLRTSCPGYNFHESDLTLFQGICESVTLMRVYEDLIGDGRFKEDLERELKALRTQKEIIFKELELGERTIMGREE